MGWTRRLGGAKWRASPRAEPPLRVLRWWSATLLAVAVVVGGGAVAMWLLGVWSPIPARVLIRLGCTWIG